MSYENIDKDSWHVCKICNEKIQSLAKIYGGSGIYYTGVFEEHLKKDHNISLENYFEDICKLDRPICRCGQCNQKTDISGKRGPFKWKEFKCGRNPGVLRWSEEAKSSRIGDGNPMYGKKPWNKGLNKNNNQSLMNTSMKLTGSHHSPEARKKQSESAKKRLIHGHTGRHHSEKTKKFLRENTLRLIREGVFKQTKTVPHIKMSEILSELNLEFVEEKEYGYFSFDFYLNKYDLLIEVDGDYFHSNPKFYPHGPKTKTQKINHSRDLSKNRFCEKSKLQLLRVWENDIINDREGIKCSLEKLLESGRWDHNGLLISK